MLVQILSATRDPTADCNFLFKDLSLDLDLQDLRLVSNGVKPVLDLSLMRYKLWFRVY